jgi:hypothetical protein
MIASASNVASERSDSGISSAVKDAGSRPIRAGCTIYCGRLFRCSPLGQRLAYGHGSAGYFRTCTFGQALNEVHLLLPVIKLM